MDNVAKPVFIPEKKDLRQPRAFQPHEFVRNVMGASAGAGSGEFDIYRGCRRRQLIREAFKTREAKERALDDAFQKKIEKNQTQLELKTAKKRKKRLKQKGRQKKPKNSSGSKTKDSNSTESSESENEHSTADDEKSEQTNSNGPTQESLSEQNVNEEVTTPTALPPSINTVEKSTSSTLETNGINRKHIRTRNNSSSSNEDENDHKQS
ncbi:unnamed protein product [Didymodactylos carnosus]|uniref:Uncharacterized protein n=1 Tax=Didymodactylos carnosus TaxID=1234261 RepID=A0A813QNH4_9BILA|nr:unnamed protein product [Didymodactylos carnosus]CAF3551354.1 unnamed protein product [Didymodactylos carnosus]